MQKAEGGRQKIQQVFCRLLPTAFYLPRKRSEHGMTLVETLVAVSILAVSIVAPMTLTMSSLSAAYYSRDLVIASNLAQEAIEAVRAVRDANILMMALDAAPEICADDGLSFHILCGIPTNAEEFIVDARLDPTDPDAIEECQGACPNLKTDNNLYGHVAGWTDTPFTRVVTAEYVTGSTDEIRVTVTVTRSDSARPMPPVELSANLYRWVIEDSGV